MMQLKAGLSALVTGGASEIGRGLCIALAQNGIFVTVVDYCEDRGEEVVAISQKENLKFHSELKFPSAIFVRCDLSNKGQVAAAFKKHMDVYGSLDICINCARISNFVPFHQDQTDGWTHAINMNLLAVIDCTYRAIKILEAEEKPGVVINLGSASGLYPTGTDPIYSATQGGMVMFTRSLSSYKQKGIRVNVLCPEFVRTGMAENLEALFFERMGGYIAMDTLIHGAFELITDESKAGACLWITHHRGLEYWPTPTEEAKYLLVPSRSKKINTSMVPSTIEIPHDFAKVSVHTLTNNFRSATSIVRAPLTTPIKPNHVLLKIIYAGVNAGDVNFTTGSYFGENKQEINSLLPFDAGLEVASLRPPSDIRFFFATLQALPRRPTAVKGVGLIAAVGDGVKNLKVGTPAAILKFGAYAEFTMVPSEVVLPVARPDPEVVAMMMSGLTASIALEKVAQMESGKTVLVTAAAGGTGQFAVQLAKLAGNKVVATCGGKDKAMLLRDLGVDRVIDYKQESIENVLKEEFPKGVDIVYESVGGDMFDLCFNALAIFGRMVVIGMVSQYQGEHGWQPRNYTGLCEKILKENKTVAGFNIGYNLHLCQQHLDNLFNLYSMGKLKVAIDPKRFVGVQSVADAVEYLHSGQSVGKVVVCIDPSYNQHAAEL